MVKLNFKPRIAVKVTVTGGGDWQVVSAPTGFTGILATLFSDNDRLTGAVLWENGADFESYDGSVAGDFLEILNTTGTVVISRPATPNWSSNAGARVVDASGEHTLLLGPGAVCASRNHQRTNPTWFTFTGGDATPDVSGAYMFKTAGTTTITEFTNMAPGQKFIVMRGSDDIAIANNANILNHAAQAITLTEANPVAEFIEDGGAAQLVAFSGDLFDGGTVAADGDGQITVMPNKRYQLTDGDTIVGIIGLTDGEEIQLLAPTTGSATLEDEGTPTGAGVALKLGGTDKKLVAADEQIYGAQNKSGFIKLSGGGGSATITPGGTIAADVNNEITVVPGHRYILTDADSVAGVIGLDDGQWCQLLSPATGSATLEDEGTVTSGLALKLSGADLVAGALDELIYTMQNVGGVVKVSPGGVRAEEYLPAILYGISPGTTDQATEISAAVAAAEAETFGSNAIILPPGEVRSNTLAFSSSVDGLRISGGGTKISTLTTATDGQAIVNFGVTHASNKTQGYILENVTLTYEGAGSHSAGSLITMFNVRRGLINNVSIDEAFGGLLMDACQHTVVTGLRTSQGGRSGAASHGIHLTSTQDGLNCAGNYFSDIELSYGAPDADTPDEGMRVDNCDGAYVCGLHVQGPDYCLRFEPAAGAANDYCTSFLASVIYLDSAGVNNLRLNGQADNSFSNHFYSSFEFRNAGGNAVSLNPDIDFDNWGLANGVIQQAQATGLFVGANMIGTYLANVFFDGNNEDDGATDGDVDISGKGVTLVGTYHRAAATTGYAIRANASSERILLLGCDLTEHAATSKIQVAGTAGTGRVEMHHCRETTQLRRGDRDFYHEIDGDGVTETAFIYEFETDEVVNFEIVVNHTDDSSPANFNSYRLRGAFKWDGTTLTEVGDEVITAHEDQVTGSPCSLLPQSGGTTNQLLLRVKTMPTVTTTGYFSGVVNWVSSMHP